MSVNNFSQSQLKIALFSLHGLIRAKDPELGRDADTGGQIKYVLELARELNRSEGVSEVTLFTRQIRDDKVAPDYAQVEEVIEGNAKIVRIPFGPRRYLKKESLWPYMEVFIDQMLAYFRRHGLPDLIHGHYADAGFCGAQLCRLLGLPFVFTGHSLGRVKRDRLGSGERDRKQLERRYHFSMRIEAEEMALETASLVVASTNQEVEQQYAIYEHYVPERMEVIPPGVDLSQFRPPGPDTAPGVIADQLARFFRDPGKPLIVTMARPDERKNLHTLVETYGESAELQRRANLVVVMGTREDLRNLPKSQSRVITRILTLIDVFDLYGKVAYPKSHTTQDVCDLYRLAASSRGVFVNPALTEPFGLTLLEAAASGVPIVATNDGGPRDIMANCQNGLLVEPMDKAAIEHALLRVLTEPDQWDQWSRNGVEGAESYYSWARHADRYLRDVRDVLEHSPAPELASSRRSRRIPEFDRLIITDLDNTLTGDSEALGELMEMINRAEHVGFGISTGRRLDDAVAMIQQLELPTPELLATSVGTELHYGAKLIPDLSWQRQIALHWNPEGIHEVLDQQPGLFLQEESHQSEFKISYQIDPEIAPDAGRIRRLLREAGLRVRVILSFGIFLDVIPLRGGDDMAIRHLLYKWGFEPEQVLIAGDSGNDEGMLKGRTLGVVVGNYSPELEKLRKMPRIYFADAPHARGIIEGIQYYHFLDHVEIPNDRID